MSRRGETKIIVTGRGPSPKKSLPYAFWGVGLVSWKGSLAVKDVILEGGDGLVTLSGGKEDRVSGRHVWNSE